MEKILCLIETNYIEELDWDDQIYWMDLQHPIKSTSIKRTIIPLIDHPHSDKENGQNEIHYHVDTRYISSLPTKLRINLPLKENQRLEYRYLTKCRENEMFPTSVKLISKSKIKHKCIHKGKCPHRGFDLSNIKPDENGIIKCPLHSLKFNTFENNKIINM